MKRTCKPFVHRNMKNRYSIFIIFIALALYSCTEDKVKLDYEPGIYEPYKQEISPIYAITDNKIIDGSLIKISSSFGSNPTDPLRKPTINFDGVYLEKKNTARVYCPTCLNEPMQIRVKNDSLFLTPKNLKEAMKFAPYTEMGLAVVNREEAERYATLRGKMTETGFILSSYNIFVKSSSITKGTTDAYYMDLDYLKSELRENDTLVYVKKETYFRKE